MLGNSWTELILGRTKESVDHYTLTPPVREREVDLES